MFRKEMRLPPIVLSFLALALELGSSLWKMQGLTTPKHTTQNVLSTFIRRGVEESLGFGPNAR